MSYTQHIQHLIKMLKSNNQNERLVACKELMDARHPLPKEAIDALNSATNDLNSEVAGAAQQALAFHAQVEKEQKEKVNVIEQDNTKRKQSSDFWGGFFIWLLIGFLFFVALMISNSELVIYVFGLITLIAVCILFFRKKKIALYGIIAATITIVAVFILFGLFWVNMQ